MTPRKRRAASKRKNSEMENEPDTKHKSEDSEDAEVNNTTDDKKIEDEKKKYYKPDSIFKELDCKVEIHEDYYCVLNQTDIENNLNRYYMIQVGVADVEDMFFCLTKWGRVGDHGQHNLEQYISAEDAIEEFEKKFKDKTGNNWTDRHNFQKKSGKYELLDIEKETEKVECDPGNPEVECQLDYRTQLLIKLIFLDDIFIKEMEEMNSNLPLGKLSKTQILKGEEILNELEQAIKDKKGKNAYIKLSSEFYTIIPHDFGQDKPPVIETLEDVSSKKDMMTTLSGIELTQSIQKDQNDGSELLHPLDLKYKKLNTKLDILDHESDEFKLLEKYAENYRKEKKKRTGPLLDAWKVDREGEAQRFAIHDDIKNRQLLWHGTCVSEVAVILKEGLRIGPHSWGFIGKGLYFFSEHMAGSRDVKAHKGMFEDEENIGFMFLVEVALGNMKTIKGLDSKRTSSPAGYDSICGIGWYNPDPKEDVIKQFDGHDVVIPVGKGIKVEGKDSEHFYNQFVVYKESQARIRYILKFNFKDKR